MGLIMTVSAESTGVVQIEIPAAFHYLGVVRACLQERLRLEGIEGQDSPLIDMICLAVHEICANQIAHAYKGRADGRLGVTVAVSAAPRRLVVETCDTGRPFDLPLRAAPRWRWEVADLPEGRSYTLTGLPPPRPSTRGGYGLYLATSILDEVTYVTAPEGNRWRLVKRLVATTSPQRPAEVAPE